MTSNLPSYDETKLHQGKYREWFWEGLSDWAVQYLKAPVVKIPTHRCMTCQKQVPLNGTVSYDDKHWICKECYLTPYAAGTRWRNTDSRWINEVDSRWMDKASCVGADSEVFFPETREAYEDPEAAWRDYCPSCPVKRECRALPDKFPNQAEKTKPFGIFGGEYFGPRRRGRPRKEDS